MKSITVPKYATRFKNKQAAKDFIEYHSVVPTKWDGNIYKDFVVVQLRWERDNKPAGWTVIPKENKSNPEEYFKALELMIEYTGWRSYQAFITSTPTLRGSEDAEWLAGYHEKYKNFMEERIAGVDWKLQNAG